MWRRIAILCAVLLLVGNARAQGWSDYEIDFGNGYRLIRANAMDIGIAKAGVVASVILMGNRKNGVGPIVEYSVTPRYIFTHHCGRAPRNLFQGDTFEEVDSSKNFYFFVDTATGSVAGPYALAQFQTQPAVIGASPLTWEPEGNPYLGPVSGVMGFGLLVGVPLVVIVILITRRRPERGAKKPHQMRG
jgi:hypothetical protein